MRLLWIALLIVAAPAAASAQVVSPYTGGVYVDPPGSLGMTVLNEQMRSAVASSWYDKSAAAKPARRHPIKSTDFKGTGKRLMEEEYYRALGASDEQKKALARVIDGMFTAFEKQGHKNNIAYALAVQIGVAIQIQTGKEVTDARAEKLALDLNDALAGDAKFRKLKSVERQKLYESCLINAALMTTFHQLGKRRNDPAMSKAAAQMASRALEGFGRK